nr:MAG TPA: hypothetical protein [Caudoviricetes sp.]
MTSTISRRGQFSTVEANPSRRQLAETGFQPLGESG